MHLRYILATFALATFLPLATSAQTTCPNLGRSLSFGSRGSDVVSLQQFLISQNTLANGNTTGYFGKLTKGAVVSFQQQNQLPTVGVVGPLTRAAIALVCSRGTSTSNSSFSALPKSGPAPLAVRFDLTRNDQNNILPSNSYTVNFGDGNSGQLLRQPCDPSGFNYPDGSNSCEHADDHWGNHTYASAGTYTATLKDSSGNSLNTVTITVVAAGTPNPNQVNVISLSPSSGPAGTSVTITGSNFSPNNGGDTVNIQYSDGSGFGGIVPSYSSDGGAITFVISHTPQLQPGVYSISVTNFFGTSNTLPFTVTAQ